MAYIIVTAVGPNRPGVLSEITTAIAQTGANIRDIHQKMVEGFFNLLLVVDAESLRLGLGEFRGRLEGLGRERGYELHVVHEEVFRTMHRV